jgi:hypothetical protein
MEKLPMGYLEHLLKRKQRELWDLSTKNYWIYLIIKYSLL